MKTNRKIGIITFHAAHNYGSVLQAYATQQLITCMGYDNEIINYRLPNQLEFYNNLYSRRFGSKDFLRRVMRLPEHGMRVRRSRKFEDFINKKFCLSGEKICTYAELAEISDRYGLVITGSDQVWNKHCTAEFKTEPAESIFGYYVAWAAEETIRVSFSSSIGGMKKDEMYPFIPMLQKYSALSVREADTAAMLSELLINKTVKNTLDPTLLLNKTQWEGLSGDRSFRDDRGYIFVYTLRQFNAAKELLMPVKSLAKKMGLGIKVLAPFSPIFEPGVKCVIDSGPEDFIALIRDAALVITDSFHGTAFSINMGTPFYVIEHSKDNRKGLLLKKLGLQERSLSSCNKLTEIDEYCSDFTDVHHILEIEREKSVKWLSDCLEDLYGD